MEKAAIERGTVSERYRAAIERGTVSRGYRGSNRTWNGTGGNILTSVPVGSSVARWVGFIFCFAAAGIVSAAEVVWLDGSRETVRRIVVKKDAVLVSFDKGLRSVPKRRLIKAIDDDGKEIAVGRQLVDEPLSEMTLACLAQLADAAPERLRIVQEQLADSMNRAVMARLRELCRSKTAEVRTRAATTLLLMGLEEPIKRGLAVALEDRNKSVRRALASTLFEVCGALQADDLVAGLGDKDSSTRVAFALVLGHLGDTRAIPTLKTAGLKNSDHHIRESAAEALAKLGDDAGVGTLVGMLSRRKHPAGSSLPEQLFVEEKVRVCGYLAKLRAKKAIPALKKAARSKHPELANAAKKALAVLARD